MRMQFWTLGSYIKAPHIKGHKATLWGQEGWIQEDPNTYPDRKQQTKPFSSKVEKEKWHLRLSSNFYMDAVAHEYHTTHRDT